MCNYPIISHDVFFPIFHKIHLTLSARYSNQIHISICSQLIAWASFYKLWKNKDQPLSPRMIQSILSSLISTEGDSSPLFLFLTRTTFKELKSDEMKLITNTLQLCLQHQLAWFNRSIFGAEHFVLRNSTHSH